MKTETYIGKPCAFGHDGTRYRSNRKCVQCYTLPVKFFEIAPDGRARAVTVTEVTYARRPGRTYWRATPLDIK